MSQPTLTDNRKGLFQGTQETNNPTFYVPKKIRVSLDLNEQNIVTLSLALSQLSEHSPTYSYKTEQLRMYLIKQWHKQSKNVKK